MANVLANKARAKVNKAITGKGTDLVFTRPGTTIGGAGATTSKTVRCIPQSLSREAAAPYAEEAGMSAADANVHSFGLMWDADVKRGDEMPLAGEVFKILKVTPTVLQNLVIKKLAIAIQIGEE